MKSQKLTLKNSALIINALPITITRLAKSDTSFPSLERFGRSIFIDSNDYFTWLTKMAGKQVTPSDTLLKSSDLQVYFDRSHTWIWQQTGKSIPEPFKINRTNYWLERDIISSSSCTQIHEVA